MGTRADFYAGRGTGAEWLGSIAFDGYPDGLAGQLRFAEPLRDERDWRERVYTMLASRDDASAPDHGWPWPWDDSATTDYAYAFDAGVIWASCFGNAWFTVDASSEDYGEPVQRDDETDEEFDSRAAGEVPVFPDMGRFKNVTYGKRSGLIVLGGAS